MLNEILRIAEANPFGFTVHLSTLEKVTDGISVAYAATQDCFDAAGLARCLDHATRHDGYLGGWLQPETGRYYFDSIRIFHDLEEAKAWGRDQQQIAVYDLTHGELHNL